MAQMALEQTERSGRSEAAAPVGWTAVVGHDGSDSAEAVLAHAARRVGPEGFLVVVHALPERVSYETRIASGSASQALLDSARRCEADQIVLGVATGRALHGAVGRVSGAVLRQAQC